MESITKTLQGGRGSKLQSKSKWVTEEATSWCFHWKGRAGCFSLSADYAVWEHKAASMQKVKVVVGIFFALKGLFCFPNLPPLPNSPTLKGRRNYVQLFSCWTRPNCLNSLRTHKHLCSQVLCCGCSQFPVKWILIKLKEKSLEA